MDAALETVQKLASASKFTLSRSEYLFQKVQFKNSKFVVYQVRAKKKDAEYNSQESEKEEWTHSMVIRMTKLNGYGDKLKDLFSLYDARLSMDYNACPDIVKFYDQGLSQYGDSIYHIARYDDPVRTFNRFISQDYNDTPIKPLDCFRVIRGALSAFTYFEEQRYILTEFTGDNLYVGSFSEDRRSFVKVMFKGHRDKNRGVSFPKFGRFFTPPEDECKDLYKSCSFSLGLMILYAINVTNGLEFSYSTPEVIIKIKSLIKGGADLLYAGEAEDEKKKSGLFSFVRKASKNQKNEKVLTKKTFKSFIEDLLELDVYKRKSPKELLKHKYIIESDEIDYQNYLKECAATEYSKKTNT